jgi:hypothetical protein
MIPTFIKKLLTACFTFFIFVFTIEAQSPAVSADTLKSWVTFLSSDGMKGRANGSEEIKLASLWIAGRYKDEGFKVPEGWKDYFQDYSYTGRQRTIEGQNVIGIIEGSDPALKDQYLVISAHFDHIGIKKGQRPDSICNGADDNAAGTCTLLGIAKTIRLLKLKPGRTLIFAAFSGEESGIRGSRYFISNCPVPLNKIYADINFEMTGHSEELGKGRFYMTGCSYSGLDELVKQFEQHENIKLVDTVKMAEQLFFASDNIAFSRISFSNGITTGIPSGTFATTTMAPYIHEVNDEAGLFDFENYALLVDNFSRMVVWLSENKSPLEWSRNTFKRP